VRQNGHGTSQALSVFLGHLVIAWVVVIILDQRHAEEPLATKAAAVMTVPIRAAP
jgi:hypothetical protein